MSEEPLHILITGAAGQIGYILTFKIASGELIRGRKIVLHLLEIPTAMKALEAVVMELNDCVYPDVDSIIYTDDLEKAFTNVDIAFLVGSYPRKANMAIETTIERNGAIFKEQGAALGKYAKKNVKVLVVGNPANTNCLIALKSSGLSPSCFCAMTRLDHNRAIFQASQKLNIPHDKIHKIVVWGNRSNTQVPDLSNAIYDSPDGLTPLSALLPPEYIHGEFIQSLSSRGQRVMRMRGASSAASAAHAAVSHMRDWIYGTPEGDFVSMAIPVPENQPYGIHQGIVFSFPCIVVDQQIKVVEGLQLPPQIVERIKNTESELIEEKDIADQLVQFE